MPDHGARLRASPTGRSAKHPTPSRRTNSHRADPQRPRRRREDGKGRAPRAASPAGGALFGIVLPPHALAGEDLTAIWRDRIDNPKTGEPIGSGPFLVERWERGKQLVLVRNPSYWGPHTRLPRPDRLPLRAVDPADAARPFRRDELDVAYRGACPQRGLPAEVRRIPGMTGHRVPGRRLGASRVPDRARRPSRAPQQARPPGARVRHRRSRSRRQQCASRRSRKCGRSTAPSSSPSEPSTGRTGAATATDRPRRGGCSSRPAAGAAPTASTSCAGERLSLRFVTTAGIRRREQAARSSPRRSFGASASRSCRLRSGVRRSSTRSSRAATSTLALFAFFRHDRRPRLSRSLRLRRRSRTTPATASGWSRATLDQADRILDAEQRARVLNGPTGRSRETCRSSRSYEPCLAARPDTCPELRSRGSQFNVALERGELVARALASGGARRLAPRRLGSGRRGAQTPQRGGTVSLRRARRAGLPQRAPREVLRGRPGSPSCAEKILEPPSTSVPISPGGRGSSRASRSRGSRRSRSPTASTPGAVERRRADHGAGLRLHPAREDRQEGPLPSSKTARRASSKRPGGRREDGAGRPAQPLRGLARTVREHPAEARASRRGPRDGLDRRDRQSRRPGGRSAAARSWSSAGSAAGSSRSFGTHAIGAPHPAYLDRIVIRIQLGSDDPVEWFRQDELDVASDFFPPDRHGPPEGARHSSPRRAHAQVRALRDQGRAGRPSRAPEQARSAGTCLRHRPRRRWCGAVLGTFPPDLRPLHSLLLGKPSPHYRPNWSGYRRRPAEARRLLEQAGCRRGADGIYLCGGQRLSLRFVTTAGIPPRARTISLVQTQLRQVGVEVVPTFAPPPAFLGQILPKGDFDVALFAWLFDPSGTDLQAITGAAEPRTTAATASGS